MFLLVRTNSLIRTVAGTKVFGLARVYCIIIRQSDNFSKLPECMGPESKKEVTNSIITISRHSYLFSCTVMKNNNESVYSMTTV